MADIFLTDKDKKELEGKIAAKAGKTADDMLAGTLKVARGGTGVNQVTKNSVLVGNGKNPMVEMTPNEFLALMNAWRVDTGYYIGTGESYEEKSANKLTFDFEPDFIWIYGYEATGPWHDNAVLQIRRFVKLDSECEQNMLNPKLIDITESFRRGMGFSKYYDCVNARRIDEKTIEWYVEQKSATTDEDWHADIQLNSSGVKYHYIAIAKGGGV